ncbi:hypothetical protein JT358_04160 [Micrococcales bacterium 31B]|nr:hypothetical protein [Micrococcales bacterium 31B]
MTTVQEALNLAMSIDGALGVTLVDLSTGLTLGLAGGEEKLDLEIASAGNSDVLRAKLRTLDALGVDDRIEDILITLTNQYHLVRVISSGGGGLFLYLVLDKHRSNLAMARHRLAQIEQSLVV